MSTPYKTRRKQLGLDQPKEQTPYQKLQAALLKVGAVHIRTISPEHVDGRGSGDTLEFWNVPTPKPGRLVIVQKRTGEHVYGGWDAYVQINEHGTDAAIRELLFGSGDRRVRYLIEPTPQRRKEKSIVQQVQQAKAIGVTETRRVGQDRRKPT